VILTLLMLHMLLSVVLIGAVSHQALSLWKPTPASGRNMTTNFRAVRSTVYTNTVAILYVLTTIGGGVVYPTYVLDAKKPLTDMNLNLAIGAFEVKEHFAILGLAILPAYIAYWRKAENDQELVTRKVLTIMVASFVWWNFMVGHILTDLRGIF
jgi:hypothetical protein